MALNRWSGSITIAELTDEPAFSEDMDALLAALDAASSRNEEAPHVIVDLSSVHYLNSSNLAQLLSLRKKLHAADRRMRLCSVRDTVWSVLLTTGLDSVFEFNDDVSTSLASLQIDV